MPIDYSSGDSITAPVLRMTDEHCRVIGTVCEAETRQAIDYHTKEPKTWRNGDPVLDYVYIVAATAARGYFTKRDADGEPVKDHTGENVLELRDVRNEDVAIICSSAWSVKAAKAAKLNPGHGIDWGRLSPKDAKDVQSNLVVTAVGAPAQRFSPPAGSGVDYGDPFDGVNGQANPAQPMPPAPQQPAPAQATPAQPVPQPAAAAPVTDDLFA